MEHRDNTRITSNPNRDHREEDHKRYERNRDDDGRRGDRRRDDRFNQRRDDPNRPRRKESKAHVSSRVWMKIEYHHFSKDSNFYDIEEWVICLENFKHDDSISLIKE